MLQNRGIRLGKRELEIMNVVWSLGEATVQDVCDRLKRPAAYSTVLTMMRTLEAKGALSHRVQHRTFVYRSEVSRDAVQSSMLTELRDLLFAGSNSLMVNSLLSQRPMTAEETAELRNILEQRREAFTRHE